jgi:hypothetical protein
MLYRPPTENATPPGRVVLRVDATKVSGHTLPPVAGKSEAERAIIGAEFYRRWFALGFPTIKQIVGLVGVSAGSLHAPLKLDRIERERVLDGLGALIEPKPPTSPGAQALATAWAKASANDREAFVSATCVGEVWNVLERCIA